MNKEFFYILYRRMQAFFSSTLFIVFRVFPIDSKLVSVCSYEGKGGFGCNPKYIVEKLHDKDPSIKYVWFLNRDALDKEMPDYIKKVPNTPVSRAYWLTRSKIWIDNYRKPYGTIKRKGQVYINTWHGMVGFKTIGLWRGKAFSKMAYLVSENDSQMVDCFLSDSTFTQGYMPKGLLYDGELMQSGSPRCDVLINKRDEMKKQFMKKYGIPDGDKCLMFAPTFRETRSKEGKRGVFANATSIDFDKVLANMSITFGGKWHLCVRLHPQVSKEETHLQCTDYIDISNEDDMYENLAGMDAMITDYSSCAMDAEMMHIPIFVFSDDTEQYREKRGEFVWELNSDTRSNAGLNKHIFPKLDATLPFSIAHNNDELERDILEFDMSDYIDKLKTYEKEIALINDGKASERVADRIISMM